MVLLGYGFGITDFLEELLTFSLATFPETFTLAGKVGQSTVQRPLNLCQAWFILVAVHWVDSNFEHYEILLRRNNVDILMSCRSWDIISEKRPKSCVHCEKTILVISGPDRWPLCGHMRVRTVFDFFQIPRRYNNPKKRQVMILDVQADVGKPHLRSLHLHYIWKRDCFQKKFILSQSWIWALAMFVQSTLIKKSLKISAIELFNEQCPCLT